MAFSGEVIFWRGPAPFYFVGCPDEPAAAVHAVSHIATYGWGCIPVSARIRDTEFGTALIPKDGGYLLPLKAVVRKAEAAGAGGHRPGPDGHPHLTRRAARPRSRPVRGEQIGRAGDPLSSTGPTAVKASSGPLERSTSAWLTRTWPGCA